MDLPNFVSKGKPISASNMNKMFNTIRAIASSYPAGKFVKSYSYSSTSESEYCVPCLCNILKEKFCRYVMPFETFFEVIKSEQVNECGSELYPVPKSYFKIYAKNGFVHYSVINGACIQKFRTLTEYTGGEVVLRAGYPTGSGFSVHTFSSESNIELLNTPIEPIDECGRLVDEKSYSFATAVGLSYQSKECNLVSVFAIKSEVSYSCSSSGSEGDLCVFPFIPSKHDSRVNLAIPIGHASFSTKWRYVSNKSQNKPTDGRTETEIVVCTKNKIQYWRGNFYPTYTRQQDRDTNSCWHGKTRFCFYEIIPTENDSESTYIYGFEPVSPLITNGYCMQGCCEEQNFD